MKNKIEVKFTKIRKGAQPPKYGSDGAAGADLTACVENDITVEPHETKMIGSGIATAIPDGYVGLVFARSGMASKRHLAPANKVGVIDSDYRGEIIVALHNHSDEPQTISPGERIAQLAIIPVYRAVFEEADTLSDTERGEGGFGSTGTK